MENRWQRILAEILLLHGRIFDIYPNAFCVILLEDKNNTIICNKCSTDACAQYQGVKQSISDILHVVHTRSISGLYTANTASTRSTLEFCTADTPGTSSISRFDTVDTLSTWGIWGFNTLEHFNYIKNFRVLLFKYRYSWYLQYFGC